MTVSSVDGNGKNCIPRVKNLSHGAIFLATWNLILLLRDVNLLQMFGVLKIY